MRQLAARHFRWLVAACAGATALLAPPVWGQVDSRLAQIAAARQQAANDLFQSVSLEPIESGMTVGQVVIRAQGKASLMQLLLRSPQIGGPRWVSNDYCQVRIQASGDAIAENIEASASGHVGEIGVSLSIIDARLAHWGGRVFTAIGASACEDAVLHLMPPTESSAWTEVPQLQREAALAAARDDAAKNVLTSIAPAPLTDGTTPLTDGTTPLTVGTTLGDALQLNASANSSTTQAGGDAACIAVTRWLQSRPVTRVEFRSDRTVELTLFVSAADLSSEIEISLKRNHNGPLPENATDWANFEDAINSHMAPPVGHSTIAASTSSTTPTGNSITPPDSPSSPDALMHPASPSPIISGSQALPASSQPTSPIWTSTPPAWIDQSLNAAASAPAGGPQLMVAQQAQTLAISQLLSKLRALPLDAQITIGQAADGNLNLAAALNRAMLRARIYKADYRADGSVNVGVSIDLRGVWEELALAVE